MKKQKTTPTDLFLAMLALMLISVSFYQTWLGLEQIFGGSSLIISLVLSLILLFLLWQIRKAKGNGQNTSGLSTIYLFFAAFCFVANFNALYTRFMRTDIYKTELRKINTLFNELETNIESKLNYGVPNAKDRQGIMGEIDGLRMQITDPRNQGKGDRANMIIERIEKLLGGKLTPLTSISDTPQGYANLADRYEQQIIQKMENLSPDEKKLKNDINNAVLYWNRKVSELLSFGDKDVDDMAQGEIDKAITEYNKLGSRATTTLGADKIKFVPTQANTQEVGKVGYAFGHALSNFGIMPMIVLAGCLLLDFGILFIILLMPNENNNSQTTFGPKRKGRTITSN
jgi:hypothetical protein